MESIDPTRRLHIFERPLETPVRVPGFGQVMVNRPTMTAVRKALRTAGVTKNQMDVRRCKGRRIEVHITGEFDAAVINHALDVMVPFGLSRTHDGRTFIVRFSLPRK